MDEGAVHCEIIDAEGPRTISLPDRQNDSLLGITPREAPFLYSSQTSRILLRSRLGILRNEKASHLTEAVLDIMGPGQGVSFHVQTGELRGRIFVGTRHGWSPAVLLRALRIQEGLELC
jgi:hypothetical protein